MKIGKLRHYVTIESFTDTPPAGDHTGEVVQVWSTVDQVFASISPFNGSEAIEGAQITEKITHKMETRYFAGLTAKNRITFNSNIYEIKQVLNTDERNEKMMLLLEQKI